MNAIHKILGAVIGLTVSSHAITFSYFNTDPQVLSDNSFEGQNFTIPVTASFEELTDVNVRLSVSGDFNGDLFAILSFSGRDDLVSVLLNGVGLGTPGHQDFGFADRGLNVWLDDQASEDIHFVTSGGATLLGNFQPDGRDLTASFSLAWVSDPRLFLLDQFNGVDPNGDWTLSIFDLSPGGTSKLLSWDLELTGPPAAVPDSAHGILAITGVFLVGSCWCFSRREQRRE